MCDKRGDVVCYSSEIPPEKLSEKIGPVVEESERQERAVA